MLPSTMRRPSARRRPCSLQVLKRFSVFWMVAEARAGAESLVLFCVVTKKGGEGEERRHII